MPLEEHTLEEPFGNRCEVCGAELTRSEIEAAREENGPFLCGVHAAEELPAGEDESAGSQPGSTDPLT